MQSIVQFGYPVLRQRCREVVRFDKELARALDAMAKVLCNRRDGAALAAPQLGKSLRAFVMDYQDVVLEAVNPVIEEESGRVVGPEGCLSLPGFSGQVPRAARVRLRWQDRSGASHVEDFEGEVARCILHETDHLDGILFIDRMEETTLLSPDNGAVAVHSVPGWRGADSER